MGSAGARSAEVSPAEMRPRHSCPHLDPCGKPPCPCQRHLPSLGKQGLIAEDFDRLTDGVKLQLTAVATGDHITHQFLERKLAVPCWEPILVGLWRPYSVGHLHHRRSLCQPRNQAANLGIVAPMPEVKCQPHRRVVQGLDQVDSLDEPLHEVTARSRDWVHWLHRQRHACPPGHRRQPLECLPEEPASMRSGMPTAAAAMHHDHRGGQGLGHLDHLDGVVDAFVKGAAITTGKSTRPLQARDAKPGGCDHCGGYFDPNVRHLRPPE